MATGKIKYTGRIVCYSTNMKAAFNALWMDDPISLPYVTHDRLLFMYYLPAHGNYGLGMKNTNLQVAFQIDSIAKGELIFITTCII